MGNSATVDLSPNVGVQGDRIDPSSSRIVGINSRDVEDGLSSLQEVTTQTASFGHKLKKQVSFDEVSIKSAKDMIGGEELAVATQKHKLHPVVIELAKKYPAPIEIELPALESAEEVFQFKRSRSTYVGEISNGKPHGRGLITTSKGALIQGLFEQGVMRGLARIIDPNGTVYLGNIENRLKNGEGFYRESGGCTIQANWLNGVTDGYSVGV